LPRLLDMEVEPFLIASTVNTVIGQRLVRRICPVCKEEYQASPTEGATVSKTLQNILPQSEKELPDVQKDLGYDIMPLANTKNFKLYRGKGCKECVGGYKGRIGIYEVFSMTNDMERLLSHKATTLEVQEQAEKDGMVTMKQDGYLKALSGLTTLEEVARVAADF
jgi:type IV pilus assembly protein PilB